jgi:DNA repair exonuclease SbcCD ATPase subunit
MLESLVHQMQQMSKALCVQFCEPPSDKALDEILKKVSAFVGMFDAGIKFHQEEEAKRLKAKQLKSAVKKRPADFEAQLAALKQEKSELEASLTEQDAVIAKASQHKQQLWEAMYGLRSRFAKLGVVEPEYHLSSSPLFISTV